VGNLVGAALGSGVGLPALYVGSNEGISVGYVDGELVGSVVGLPSLYVGAKEGD